MKNLIKTLFTLAFVVTLTSASAASKKEVVTKEYSTDIDCHSCATKIMNTLPYQKGIKQVNVDLSTKTVTVEYDASKSSDEAIIASLSKVDIEATVATEEDKKSCTEDGCCATKK